MYKVLGAESYSGGNSTASSSGSQSKSLIKKPYQKTSCPPSASLLSSGNKEME
jgi:hypothetical protein